jgi:hypothetical protein
MAAEFEELRLIVSLTDNASAGLNNYKKSLEQFTSGQPAQHLENFKKHNLLLTQVLKATGLEATGTGKAFIELGSRLAIGAGAVGIAGVAIYKAAAIVNSAAKGIVDQANALKSFGVGFPEGKNVLEQYARLGISEKESIENIGAATQAQFETQKRNRSELFEDLKKLALGDNWAEEFRNRMAQAKTLAELMNTAQQGEIEIQDVVERRYGNLDKHEKERLKAEFARQYRQLFHFNEAFLLAKQINELEADRAKRMKDMADAAQKFRDQWNATAVNLGQIVDIFLTGKGISTMLPILEQAKDLTEAILRLTTEGMKALKDENFWKLLMHLPPDIPGMPQVSGSVNTLQQVYKYLKPDTSNLRLDQPQPFVGGGVFSGGAEGEKIEQNTRELKRLNDNLYQLLHPEATQGAPLRYGLGGDGAASMDSSGASIGGTPPGLSFGGLSRLFGGLSSGMGFGIPIPHLQHGGIINKPTIALVGERGPEAVVPIRAMQYGGIVDKPTLILAGENGPEAVVPLARKRAGIAAIGASETGFSTKEAYSDFYNDPVKGHPGYNANVARMGSRGADYGYFQMNQEQAERASSQYGMDPESARALYGGGREGAGDYSISDQTRAAFEYVQNKYPEAFENLGRTGDFSAFRKALGKEWFALNRKEGGVSGAVATAAYHSYLGAMTQQSRDVLDSAARERQRIEAAGHIKIRVGGGTGPTPLETLFKPVQEQLGTQMTPTNRGLSEHARSAPPTFAAE